MTTHPPPPSTPPPPPPAFKSRPGLSRVWKACCYSADGLRAAWTHEAAFRQELAVGLPLIALACWIAPGRWHALALCAAVVGVWIVELLNSAIEALADAVTLETHPLIKRSKDIASAAVMTSIAAAMAVWAVVLWP